MAAAESGDCATCSGAAGADSKVEAPAGPVAPRRFVDFDPTTLGLAPTFVLTNFSKVPQDKLLSYVKTLGSEFNPNEIPGLDCSVVATRHKGLFLVSTTDFFYPLVEDPYAQGRIAACNVLSDMYAMGVVDIDTVLMLLAVSSDMSAAERDAVTTQMMKGFNDTCVEAHTSCTGGQTVINPWPIIGGVASSVCSEADMIRPIHAVPGDVLVLTKPLGTQVVVNAQQWRRQPTWWAKIADIITEEEVLDAFGAASESMGRLNRTACMLMRKHGGHACTDVTGFGILGHLRNLAKAQDAEVDMIIDALPVLHKMAAVDAAVGGIFKLVKGFSAETSGGLMFAMPPEAAAAFVEEITATQAPAWIIGRVVAGTRTADISPDVRIIDV